MRKVGLLLVASVFSLHIDIAASSDFYLFAICESPKGPALSYGDAFNLQDQAFQKRSEGFKEDMDGFQNMNPVFYITTSEPNILYSIWGPTIPDDLKDTLPKEITKKKTERNIIISHTRDAVTAVISYGNETWIMSLYPNVGAGYYSRHKISSDFVKENYYMTRGAIMASKCVFQ